MKFSGDKFVKDRFRYNQILFDKANSIADKLSKGFDGISVDDIEDLIRHRMVTAIAVHLLDSSFGIDPNKLSIYFLPREPFEEWMDDFPISEISEFLINEGGSSLYENDELEKIATAFENEVKKIREFLNKGKPANNDNGIKDDT